MSGEGEEEEEEKEEEELGRAQGSDGAGITLRYGVFLSFLHSGRNKVCKSDRWHSTSS